MARIYTLLLVTLFLTTTCCKKYQPKSEKKHFSKKVPLLDLLDEEMLEEHEYQRKQALLHKKPIASIQSEDHCTHYHCGPGKSCHLDSEGTPYCRCIETCPAQTDSRRMVCSNHNETWDSACHLYRMRCLCTEGDYSQCLHHKHKHAHIEYYGHCKDMPECTPDELADFPRRMREWLFAVMKDLARRKILKSPYLQLEEEAESMQSRRWVNAVIWKFCELDAHPHDRWISRHELFPLRSSLLSMEHCVAPFLDSCDSNDDHRISLVEWGTCLGLHPNEIRNRCPHKMHHRQSTSQ